VSANVNDLGPKSDRGFFGHPWGLSTLFATEMWERFSVLRYPALDSPCYGRHALLDGGWGFERPQGDCDCWHLFVVRIPQHRCPAAGLPTGVSG
jgi:hypothetical protein